MTVTPISNGQFNPEQPFTWAAGGQRMTPKQIEQQRKIAASLMQPDYSPIASPWQGLARVAGNLTGALQTKRLDNTAGVNADYNQQAIARLLAPDAGQTDIAGALSSADPSLQGLGMQIFKQQHPAPRPPSAFEELGALGGLTPEQIRAGAAQKFNNDIDPLTNMVVGGNSVIGPRSMVQQQFGGAPATPVQPPADAVNRLRANPAEASQFDEVFGPGASSKVLKQGGQTPSASGSFR